MPTVSRITLVQLSRGGSDAIEQKHGCHDCGCRSDALQHGATHDGGGGRGQSSLYWGQRLQGPILLQECDQAQAKMKEQGNKPM